MKIPKLKDIKNYLLNHPLLKRLEEWARNRSMPGFFGVPIFDVIIFLFNEFKRHDLNTRSNSIAFSFFLSLFPSLMALFTTIPLIKNYIIRFIPETEGADFDLVLQTEIKRIMPGVSGDRLFGFIQDITENPRVGLLSFGFFLAIFFASNGMINLMRGFEKSYMQTFKKRSGFKKRLIAMLLTLLVGGFFVGSIILILLGQFIIDWITDFSRLNEFSGLLLNLLRWVVVILLFYISIAIIYRYGAPTRRRFKIFTPGSALATVLCILSSIIFSAYVDNFDTYNKLYGSIGAIIALMLWIQINSLFILVGFELNASIAVNRDLKEEIPDEDEDL